MSPEGIEVLDVVHSTTNERKILLNAIYHYPFILSFMMG